MIFMVLKFHSDVPMRVLPPRHATESHGDLSEMRVDFPDADQSCGWDSEDMGFIGSMVGPGGARGWWGPGCEFFRIHWYPH